MLIRLMIVWGMISVASPCFGVSSTNIPMQSSTPSPSAKSSSASTSSPKSSSHVPFRPSGTKHSAKPRSAPPPPPQETILTKGDAKQIFSAIENQLNAIQSKDYITAYYSYTSEEFKKITPLDEFIFFVSSYPIFTNNKNSLFRHLRLDNHIATLEGTMTASTGEEREVEYFFVKESALWKIIGIKLLDAEPAPHLKPQTEQRKENPLQEFLKEHPLEKREQKKKPEAAIGPDYKRERYYTY